MENKNTIIAVTIFVLVIAGMFGFAAYQRTNLAEQSPEPAPAGNQQQTDERFAYIERVTAKHYFIDGVHTLAGEIDMPTPCDLLEADVMVAESFPEQVTVDFTVINNADFCAQVITPQRFMVSVEASEDATFNARFEGRPIELNLVPAAEGETPEDFELFIKG